MGLGTGTLVVTTSTGLGSTLRSGIPTRDMCHHHMAAAAVTTVTSTMAPTRVVRRPEMDTCKCGVAESCGIVTNGYLAGAARRLRQGRGALPILRSALEERESEPARASTAPLGVARGPTGQRRQRRGVGVDRVGLAFIRRVLRSGRSTSTTWTFSLRRNLLSAAP